MKIRIGSVWRWILQTALLISICLAVYAITAGFQPAESVDSFSESVAVPLGIVFTVGCLYLQQHLLEGGWIRKLSVLCAALFVFTLFAWAMTRSGLPWLFTYVNGQEQKNAMFVVAKGNGKFRWRDYCESKFLRLEDTQQNLQYKICPHKEGWSAYPVGQPIVVTMQSSALGSYVKSIESAK